MRKLFLLFCLSLFTIVTENHKEVTKTLYLNQDTDFITFNGVPYDYDLQIHNLKKGKITKDFGDNTLTIKFENVESDSIGLVKIDFVKNKMGIRLFPSARSQIAIPYGGLKFSAYKSDNTTPDNKQIFLLIGDSKSAYSDDTDQVSPSPSAGTAFQWDHVTTNSVIALTSTDLIHSGNGLFTSNRGSPWPQFCITYNSLTSGTGSGQVPGGYKPVIVDGHVYGSFWSNATASLSWDTNGRLYEAARERAFNCMHDLHLKKIAGVFITLGINDNGSATALATVQANMQALINRIAADFGSDVPVYITMTGVDNSTPGARLGGIRSSIRDLSINNSQVHETVNEGNLYSWGLYDASPLHYKQAGNNYVGTATARYIFNAGGYSDKKSRQIIYCYMYDQLNSTKNAAINTFVTSERSAGNLAALDMLQIYIGDTEKNILIDWVGLTSPLKPTNAFTFNANTNISTDGASTYLRIFWNMTMAKYASQNDVILGFKGGTLTTAAGTAANAMGATAGNVILISQDASSRTNFSLENATPQTYTTDPKPQSNTEYAVWRTTSTNLELLKGGSIVSTKSVASSGLNSVMWHIGGSNNANADNPTTSRFYQGEWHSAFEAKQSTFNYSTFLTDIATLRTALAIP